VSIVSPPPEAGPQRPGHRREPSRRAPGSTGAGEELWHLEDRRDFLRRSLDDAEREHEAGDLGDDDYSVLRRRDERDLAAVEGRLAELRASCALNDGTEPSESDAPGSSKDAAALDRPARSGHRLFKRRRWMVVVGIAALVAGAVLLVVDVASPRLPGETATGSVTLHGKALVTQQVAQAATLVGEGHVVTALQLYRTVLSENPGQPEALAEGGWLEWETGDQTDNAALESSGRALVTRATVVAPTFYAGHLYLGTIDLLGDHDASGAVTQYRLFLSEHPPARSLDSATPDIRQAFTLAGIPLPSGVPSTGAPTAR
jgi:hypothetical protein